MRDLLSRRAQRGPAVAWAALGLAAFVASYVAAGLPSHRREPLPSRAVHERTGPALPARRPPRPARLGRAWLVLFVYVSVASGAAPAAGRRRAGDPGGLRRAPGDRLRHPPVVGRCGPRLAAPPGAARRLRHDVGVRKTDPYDARAARGPGHRRPARRQRGAAASRPRPARPARPLPLADHAQERAGGPDAARPARQGGRSRSPTSNGSAARPWWTSARPSAATGAPAWPPNSPERARRPARRRDHRRTAGRTGPHRRPPRRARRRWPGRCARRSPTSYGTAAPARCTVTLSPRRQTPRRRRLTSRSRTTARAARGQRATGNGLTGLRERLALAGGTLEASAARGAGSGWSPACRGRPSAAVGSGAMTRTIKVLLAEDQSMVREALAALLGLEPDIEVVAQVARGDEVLDAVAAHEPDVALLDIEMPGAHRASRRLPGCAPEHPGAEARHPHDLRPPRLSAQGHGVGRRRLPREGRARRPARRGGTQGTGGRARHRPHAGRSGPGRGRQPADRPGARGAERRRRRLHATPRWPQPSTCPRARSATTCPRPSRRLAARNRAEAVRIARDKGWL